MLLVGVPGSGKSSLLASLVDTLRHPPRIQRRDALAAKRSHVNNLPTFRRNSIMQDSAKMVIRLALGLSPFPSILTLRC